MEKGISRDLTGYIGNSKAIARGALKALIRTVALTLSNKSDKRWTRGVTTSTFTGTLRQGVPGVVPQLCRPTNLTSLTSSVLTELIRKLTHDNQIDKKLTCKSEC